MKLRKLLESWQPQEFPGLKVGEIIDFPGSHETLCIEGSAQLVDEAGNALPLPGTVFTCPMPGCLYHTESTIEYTDHVIEAHVPGKTIIAKKSSGTEAEVVKKSEVKKVDGRTKTPEERKAFGERMAEARRLAKEKRETKVETAIEGA